MIKRIIIISVFISCFTTTIFGSEKVAVDTSSGGELSVSEEKIIAEYKKFAAGVKKDVREEIVAFRKAVAALNKQKRDLYKKLSQEGQEYLTQEQSYKKKLPLKQKKLINIENPGASPKNK